MTTGATITLTTWTNGAGSMGREKPGPIVVAVAHIVSVCTEETPHFEGERPVTRVTLVDGGILVVSESQDHIALAMVNATMDHEHDLEVMRVRARG